MSCQGSCQIKISLRFSDINAENNVYGVAIVQDETVFPSTKVECVGQIIGVIIAKDQAIAQRAAKMVWLVTSLYQSNTFLLKRVICVLLFKKICLSVS